MWHVMGDVRVTEGPQEGLIGTLIDETEDRALLTFFGAIVQSFPKSALERLDGTRFESHVDGSVSVPVLSSHEDDE